jgi:hypothetical protein
MKTIMAYLDSINNTSEEEIFNNKRVNALNIGEYCPSF